MAANEDDAALSGARTDQAQPERASGAPARSSGKTAEKGCLKKTGIGCLTLLVVIFATMVLTGRRSVDAIPPPPPPGQPVAADALIPSFRLNPEASRAAYVGKRFPVLGYVAGSRTRDADAFELLIRSDNGYVVFEFATADGVGGLYENDLVVASGLCQGAVPGNAIVMGDAALDELRLESNRERYLPATVALANKIQIERLKIKMRTQELADGDPRFARPRNAFVLQLGDSGDFRSFDFTLLYSREPRNLSRVEAHCLGIVENCRKALKGGSYLPDDLGIVVTARARYIPRGFSSGERGEYGQAVFEPHAEKAVFTPAAPRDGVDGASPKP